MRLSEIKTISGEDPLPTGGKFVYKNGKPYSYVDEEGIEHIPAAIDNNGNMVFTNEEKWANFVVYSDGYKVWYGQDPKKEPRKGDKCASQSSSGRYICVMCLNGSPKDQENWTVIGHFENKRDMLNWLKT